MNQSTNYADVLANLTADHRRQAELVEKEKLRLDNLEAAILAVCRVIGVEAGTVLGQAGEKRVPEEIDQADHTGVYEPAADQVAVGTATWSFEIPESLLRIACSDKSIADAAIAVLAIVGKPLSDTVLTQALVAGEVAFSTSEPARAVRFALQRKQKESGAVVHIGEGTWGLSAWKDVTNPNHLGFVSHRDKASHMRASMEGLQEAKKAGVKLGAKPRITSEHAPLISEMMGRKEPMYKIAGALGISREGLNKAIKRLREQGFLKPNQGSEAAEHST